MGINRTAGAGLLLAAIIAMVVLFAVPLNGFATSSTTPVDEDQQLQQTEGPNQSCELHVRWSLRGWSGDSGVPIGDAFAANASADGDFSARVTAVYTWFAAEQSWESHFPGFADIPGPNDFSTFTSGTGYWIALSDGPSVTWAQSGDVPTPVPTATPSLTSTP